MQVKLSAFYGANVPRPHTLIDATTGKVVKEREDAPSVHKALIDWAKKVPFEAGGTVVKPQNLSELLPKARKDFQIFCETQRIDIIAANPNLSIDGDDMSFRAAAQTYWKDILTEEERHKYRQQAQKERELREEKEKEMLKSNPLLATKKEKQEAYIAAKANQLAGARNMQRGISSKKSTVYKNADIFGDEQPAVKGRKRTHRQNKVPESTKRAIQKQPMKPAQVRSKAMKNRRLMNRAAATGIAQKAQYLLDAVEAIEVADERRVLSSSPVLPSGKKNARRHGTSGMQIRASKKSKKETNASRSGYTAEFELMSDNEETRKSPRALRRANRVRNSRRN